MTETAIQTSAPSTDHEHAYAPVRPYPQAPEVVLFQCPCGSTLPT